MSNSNAEIILKFIDNLVTLVTTKRDTCFDAQKLILLLGFFYIRLPRLIKDKDSTEFEKNLENLPVEYFPNEPEKQQLFLTMLKQITN